MSPHNYFSRWGSRPQITLLFRHCTYTVYIPTYYNTIRILQLYAFSTRQFRHFTDIRDEYNLIQSADICRINCTYTIRYDKSIISIKLLIQCTWNLVQFNGNNNAIDLWHFFILVSILHCLPQYRPRVGFLELPENFHICFQ